METENETKIKTKPKRWWRRNKKKSHRNGSENYGGSNISIGIMDDPSILVMLWHVISFPFKMIGKFFKGIGDLFDGFDLDISF